MVLVVEMTIQTKTVKLVLRVSVIQTLQELQLLQTSLVPEKNKQQTIDQAMCIKQ